MPSRSLAIDSAPNAVYLNLIDQKVCEHTGQPLTNLQRLLLEECWQTSKKTYEEIAESHNYSSSYIQQRVAPSLWRLLSEIVGEKITKSNCRGALFRYIEQLYEKQPAGSTASSDPLTTEPLVTFSTQAPQGHPPKKSHAGSPATILELPTDSVPIGSPLYIPREPLESHCYETILQVGALIRIKAPRQMGKTSLMNRIIHQTPGYRAAVLNFQQFDQAFFSDLNRFLRCVCANLARQLKLPPEIDEYWDEDVGSKMSCTHYLEEYILEGLESPLILVLEEAGELFEHEAVAREFFTMLRAWHEYTKHDELWKKLRLILVQSTEMYLPLNINQSPFNVGLEVALRPFDRAQVKHLAARSGVNLSEAMEEALMALVAGHPYLVSLMLYHLAKGEASWEDLLATVSTDEGIFKDHLHRHLWTMQKHTELGDAFKQALEQPVPVSLPQKQAFKLNSLGLVRLEGNRVKVSCDLYQQYFSAHL